MNDMTGSKRIRGNLTKIILLSVAGLLITVVSASVLNSMYMQSSPISAETPKVQFVTASDSTAAGATVGTNGTYVSLNSLGGWPNAPRTYQAAVGIQNIDTSSRSFELKFDQAGDWSGDTGSVGFITVVIRDSAGGTQQGSTITVGTPGSSTGSLSIPAGTTWVVEWNIRWLGGALSTNTVAVELTLSITGE